MACVPVYHVFPCERDGVLVLCLYIKIWPRSGDLYETYVFMNSRQKSLLKEQIEEADTDIEVNFKGKVCLIVNTIDNMQKWKIDSWPAYFMPCRCSEVYKKIGHKNAQKIKEKEKLI